MLLFQLDDTSLACLAFFFISQMRHRMLSPYALMASNSVVSSRGTYNGMKETLKIRYAYDEKQPLVNLKKRIT